MGAEPGRPNELSPITRIDTARVRPVQSAAGRSFIEPGSPWQNPLLVGQVRGLPPLPRHPAKLMALTFMVTQKRRPRSKTSSIRS